MATSNAQHRTDIDTVDETNEGGQVHYRWSCLCRRTGQWVDTSAAAEKGGRAHERRFQPKPQGPKGLRELLRLG